MKLAPRDRKPLICMEEEFPQMLRVLLPRSYRIGGSSSASAAKKAAKKAAPAVAKKQKVAAKKKQPSARKTTAAPIALKKQNSNSSAAAGVAPIEVKLTRNESAAADKLYRRGTQTHKWQFINDNGKWEDYDSNASNAVEMAYASWIVNPQVDVRSVQSGSQKFHYQVDFNAMQQMNISHNAHKVRKVQRVPLIGN